MDCAECRLGVDQLHGRVDAGAGYAGGALLGHVPHGVPRPGAGKQWHDLVAVAAAWLEVVAAHAVRSSTKEADAGPWPRIAWRPRAK
eukprot:4089035-Pyramimonas_sp.AAC.1